MEKLIISTGIILMLYFLLTRKEGKEKLAGLVIAVTGLWCFDISTKIYNIVEFFNGSLTTLTAFWLAIIILLDHKGKIKNPKKIMGVTSIVSAILSFMNAYQFLKEILYIKSELSNYAETAFYGPVFSILVIVLLGALHLICGIKAILNMNMNIKPKIFIPISVVTVFAFVNIYALNISSHISAIALPHDLAMFAQSIVYPSAILLTFHLYSNNQLPK